MQWPLETPRKPRGADAIDSIKSAGTESRLPQAGGDAWKGPYALVLKSAFWASPKAAKKASGPQRPTIGRRPSSHRHHD